LALFLEKHSPSLKCFELELGTCGTEKKLKYVSYQLVNVYSEKNLFKWTVKNAFYTNLEET
jgi:hypothetical protein